MRVGRNCLGPLLLLCLLASPARAQPYGVQEAGDATDSSNEVLDEVVVTGTRIKRRDFASPSPLVTIERADLEFSGQPTLEEYLNKLPQMQPTTGRANNNGSDGTAELNLRGMGADRTLVLLNGRRVAPSGTGSAIDVNNLPSILVDRVEIITGGASTVYGSDAIAGVVNFITRDDFAGFSVEGGYNVTAEGDADIWDANLVYGLDLANGGNITFYGGRYEREELFAGEREISSVVWRDDWKSGELQLSGSSTIPSGLIFDPALNDLGDGPVRVTWNPDGTPRAFVHPDDRYNYQPVNYLQTPLSRDSLGILGQVPISGAWETYFEAAYARNQAESTQAPAPFGGFVVVNTDNPILTPETQELFSREEFNTVEPGLARMFLGSRLLGFGPRIQDHDRKYLRLLGGVRGTLGDGWDLDAWITYTDAQEDQRNRNTGSISRVQQGLLVDPATGQCFDISGGCVPVDLFGEDRISPEALDFIRVEDLLNVTSRTQWLASAVVTGAPFEIRGRPVDMAFGAEWRSDQAHFRADDLLFTGDAIGWDADAPIDGSESVYELYSEAIWTLFEGRSSGQALELEIGGRWSSYDHAGTVETWKVGLNWRLSESLLFRTMLQHAVRAPNNAELFTAQFSEEGFLIAGGYVDLCSASEDPVGSGNAEKCILQGLAETQIGVFEATKFYPTEFVSGGNPNLQPESSDTFTAGAVFTPVSVPELTFSIDYYDLQVEDTIGGINPDLICFDPLNTAGVFCENLERDSTGNVFRFTALTENRGLLATKGIDFQAQYETDLPAGLALVGDFASLSLGAMLTHVFSLDFQENIVTQIVDCAGLFGKPCHDLFGNGVGTYPENRLTTNFNYDSGPFTAHLAWRWIDGTDNGAPLISEICCGIAVPVEAVPSVSSWNYFDLGLAWAWDNGLLLRLGINNLTDKEPPLMGDNQLENNTDALMYDVFGRTYYLNLRYQFGF